MRFAFFSDPNSRLGKGDPSRKIRRVVEVFFSAGPVERGTCSCEVLKRRWIN